MPVEQPARAGRRRSTVAEAERDDEQPRRRRRRRPAGRSARACVWNSSGCARKTGNSADVARVAGQAGGLAGVHGLVAVEADRVECPEPQHRAEQPGSRAAAACAAQPAGGRPRARDRGARPAGTASTGRSSTPTGAARRARSGCSWPAPPGARPSRRAQLARRRGARPRPASRGISSAQLKSGVEIHRQRMRSQRRRRGSSRSRPRSSAWSSPPITTGRGELAERREPVGVLGVGEQRAHRLVAGPGRPRRAAPRAMTNSSSPSSPARSRTAPAGRRCTSAAAPGSG